MKSILNKAIIFLILLCMFLTNAFSKEIRLVIQNGHRGTSKITAAAFHPDGKVFASGADDRTIKLWNIKTGRLLNTFTGHEGTIKKIGFSYTGDTLVSLSMDRTIKLWEVSSGDQIKTIFDGGFYPTGGALHPESRIMITAGRSGRNGYIKIWDIVNEEVITKIGRKSYPADIILFNQGNSFAAIENDSRVYLWNLKKDSREPEFELPGLTGKAESVSASETGILAGIDDLGNIVLWEIGKKNIIKNINIDSRKLQISPNGKMLATQNEEGSKILILNSVNGKIEREFMFPESIVTTFRFSPDSKYFLTGLDNGRLSLWNIAEGKKSMTYKGINQSIAATAFSSDETIGAFAISRDNKANSLMIYDYENSSISDVLPLNLIQVNELKFQNNSDILAVCGAGFLGRSIYFYNVKTQEMEEFPVKSESASVPRFSDGSRFFAFAVNDTVKVYDLKNNIMKGYAVSENKAPVSSAVFKDNEIVFGNTIGSVYSYNFENDKKEKILSLESDKVIELAYTRNFDTLTAVSSSGIVIFWDEKRNKTCKYKLPLKKNEKISSALISGNKLFTSSRDRKIKIWDLYLDLKLTDDFEHQHTIISCDMQIMEQRQVLITGGTEGLIKLWDLSNNGRELTFFINDEDSWASVTPNGYFNGSKKGLENLHWVKNDEPLDLDVYFEDYFKPYLLEVLLRKDFDIKQILRSKPIAGLPLPPQISFFKDINLDVTSHEDYAFTILADPVNSSVSKLLIYHNSKLAKTFNYDKNDYKKRQETIDLKLLAGENKIEAVAYDAEELHSNRIERTVMFEKDFGKPDLYLLAVGINDYGPERLKLSYAVKDAESFADVIANNNAAYKNIHILRLANEDASKENIKQKLSEIQKKARKRDSFIFFFAGHGFTFFNEDSTKADFNFFLYDEDREYDLKKTHYRLSTGETGDMIAKIKANKQLLIIDACQSAEVIDNIYWQIKLKSLQSKNVARISNVYGVNIFTSALSAKPAYENYKLEHGLFTYVMLEGLTGRAAFGDKTVSVGELKLYLDKELPKKAKEMNLYQYPYSRLDGADFDLRMYGE